MTGKEMKPTEAFCAVTYRCNCRCTICDVWQKEPSYEVEPSFFYRLPPTLRLVNLTGGEPFMRKDLPEIAEAISDRCPDARLHLSTNGLLTSRIVDDTRRILKINCRTGVRVSLDGLGEVHDRIRGVPGAFEKAMATVKALRDAGVRDLGVAFTLTAGNEEQLVPVYHLARSMGLDFSTAVVHSSAHFFGEKGTAAPDADLGTRMLRQLQRLQLSGWSVKQWLRAYFTDGQIDYLNDKPRKIRCGAGREFFFLDPGGNVYPCPVLDRPFGSLTDDTLEGLVRRNPAIISQVDRCRLHCWMICTVRPIMRRRLPRCIVWAAGEKWRQRGTG